MYNKLVSLKLIVILTFSSLAVVTAAAPAFSKLKDFKDGIEKEDNSNKGKYKGSSSGSDSDSSCAGACAEFAIKAAFGFWALHHMLVYYEKHPYHSKEVNFINYYFPYSNIFKPQKEEKGNMRMAADIDQTEPPSNNPVENLDPFQNKFYYYTLAAGGQWARDEGSGFLVEFRGKFMQHFGPEFSARSIWDGEDNIQFYSGGLNLSLFQNSYFSMDFYITGAFMRGIVERDGVGFGTVITSFPFKPVTLFIKVGGLDFGKTDFLDFEGRLGFMIGRVEIFAGYQMIHNPDIQDIGGPVCGVRVFL